MSKKQIAGAVLGGIIIYLLAGPVVKTKLVDPHFQNQPSTLKEAVDNALLGAKGVYGISIKDLKTGETYSFNEDRIFEAGSLYKIWVLLTAFEQIEKGELKEDQVLSQDIAVLNRKFNIASESAELREGVISLTIKEAMQQMITISHNYAALLLTEKVKISKVADFLKRHKFNDSIVGQPPKTTPKDTALFLEKLYKGELSNGENTQRILDLLKKQQLNEGLPKYLPKEAGVAHKTGEIGWFKHDAGIVFLDGREYIIVVMSESDSPSGAQERIAEISKAVYEYFSKTR